jgi:hypothetical protein
MINLRGDIIVSCDTNDRAFHGGGENVFSLNQKGNNHVTIGIELEPCMGRDVAKGKVRVLNYPDRMMLCLAIYCKKLSVVCPISKTGIGQNVISRIRDGCPRTQANKYKTGYVQHLDVTRKKVDAGAQFDIAPGKKGSGWNQLWAAMKKIRVVRPTDVYTSNDGFNAAGNPDTAAFLKQLARTVDNKAQRLAMLQAHYTQAGSLRSLQMQGRSRSLENTAALGQARFAASYISAKTARISCMAERFDTAVLKTTQGGYTYDETNATWNWKDA